MIAEVAAVLLPVFTIAALGYVWRRTGAAFDLPFVTRLIMNVAGPCLVLESLSRLSLPLPEFFAMVGAAAAILLATALVSFALLTILRLPIRSYLPALTIGNVGNLGLPLCLFAFGEQGLALGVALYVTNSVGQFTLVPLLQSRASVARTLLTTPVIYAAIGGLSIKLSGAAIPDWLDETLRLLGGTMIPLMLLALGHTVGGLRARNLRRAFGLGSARLLIAFGVAVGVSTALGIHGVAQGVLVLQGSMPAAVFSYLFAARYDRDADDIAGIVLVSTLLAAVALPFTVSYSLWLAR
ncbi:MAG TPA: AEC family transporter [Gammaproteobacteria bacterium]|nr:AEC family transporter [Gammaproteobacteria bacterium]